MLPDESTAIPVGEFSWALVAAPLSPLYPAVPFPATAANVPDEFNRITTFASENAKSRFPERSVAKAVTKPGAVVVLVVPPPATV
jgi:hypothetical protein